MQPASIDDFAQRASRCTTVRELFDVFRGEMQSEGFQNVIFVKALASGDFETPFLDLPDGFARDYLGQNLHLDDPVFTMIRQTDRPFVWRDMMKGRAWSRAKHNVVEQCRELGARDGMTLPFHGPGGACDLFSLSFRERRVFDPARICIVNLKAYACWRRYHEIEAARLLLDGAGFGADGAAPLRPSGPGPHHLVGTLDISEDECRGLVIVDVSYRRYRAGLFELNDGLPAVVGATLFHVLMDRGLIFDEPDDDRWQYVTRVSPIARSHLRCCPLVEPVRSEVWQLHVSASERPGN